MEKKNTVPVYYSKKRKRMSKEEKERREAERNKILEQEAKI